MARPLRIEYGGAFYHVINRGNRCQTVFESESDAELFLERLSEFSESYNVEIISYCLMGNHFHLYLKTLEANLSKFMQAFMTSFTISKNRRDGSSGHLFQGRYKAFLVEDKAYGLELSRYIHLNPARTKFTTGMDLAKRRAILRECQYSSYPSIIGIRSCPKWVKRSFLLDKHAGTLAEKQSMYSKYVEGGLIREIENPMKYATAQAILGTEPFVDRMRRGLTHLSDKINIRREMGSHAKLAASVPFEEVMKAVSKTYAVKSDTLLEKNSRNNEARQVLMFLACKYCRGKNSLSELGQMLGPITVGALTSSRYKVGKNMSNDRKLMRRVKDAEVYIVK